MNTLEPFRAPHVTEIILSRRASREVSIYGLDAFAVYAMHPSYTARTGDGKIIGSAGVFVVHPGLGEAWVLQGALVHRHATWFHRTIKRVLLDIARQFELHRVQAHVDTYFEDGQRWMRLLGFHAEGVLEKFGPDKHDYITWVMFPKGGW